MTDKKHINIIFDPVSVSLSNIYTTSYDDFTKDAYWKRLQYSKLNKNIDSYPDSQDKSIVITTMEDLSVEIDDEGKETLDIHEHVFLVDINQAYFHALYDNFGQYLAAKYYMPDLKPIILSVGLLNFSDYSGYKEVVFKLGSISRSDVIDIRKYSKINFKKVSTIHADANTFLRGVSYFLSQHNLKAYNMLNIKSHQKNGLMYVTSRELKKLFAKSREVSQAIPTKKIFISRKQRRNLVESTFILKKFLVDNGVTWDDSMRSVDPNNILTTLNFRAFEPASVMSNLSEIDFRYISAADEDMIEDFFRGLGYEIVSVENMPISDQMRLYASSTHIATLAGAGSINSLFMKDQGTFIYLSVDTRYSFYHEDIIDTITPNSIIVFDKRKDFKKQRRSVSEMLKELEQNYLDRL